jgi:threonine/homoserine/homoserine lactone efflux protein
MSLQAYGAFVIAASIVLLIPGPTIILVITRAAGHGKRALWPLTAGVTLGDFTAMTLSLMGLGAVLATSAAWFTTLKWIGAGYLVYLGIKLWRTKPPAVEASLPVTNLSARRLLADAYLVTALNPKSIAFFVAFLPQFVTPGKPVLLQLLMLGGTFLALASLNAFLYGLFAGRLRGALDHPRMRRWFQRCGGSALIGAGIFTAALKRTG